MHGLGAYEEKRWEGVRELSDTDGTNDTHECVEVGDDGTDDKGNSPVDWDQEDPDYFTGLGGKRWHAEDFNTDVVVDDCCSVSVCVQSG